MKHIRKIKELLTLICLGVILALTYNVFANTHTHVLASGVVITHAHSDLIGDPVSGNETGEDHTHDSYQYLLLDHLSISNILPFLFLVVLADVLIKKVSKAKVLYAFSVIDISTQSFSGRAPPLFS